jgi:hypothetical protein
MLAEGSFTFHIQNFGSVELSSIQGAILPIDTDLVEYVS